jgi:hypothetical protein
MKKWDRTRKNVTDPGPDLRHGPSEPDFGGSWTNLPQFVREGAAGSGLPHPTAEARRSDVSRATKKGGPEAALLLAAVLPLSVIRRSR